MINYNKMDVTCTHTSEHKHTHTHTSKHTHTHKQTHACAQANTHTHTSKHTHAHITATEWQHYYTISVHDYTISVMTNLRDLFSPSTIIIPTTNKSISPVCSLYGFLFK